MGDALPQLASAGLTTLSLCAPRRVPIRQVCQISGLIINDEESRLQDHYSGRNYK